MKISGIDAKVYIRRCLTHIPVGIGIVWLILLEGYYALIGISLLLIFLVYQINEDFCIKDYAYPDIAGCGWGLILSALCYKYFISPA